MSGHTLLNQARQIAARHGGVGTLTILTLAAATQTRAQDLRLLCTSTAIYRETNSPSGGYASMSSGRYFEPSHSGGNLILTGAQPSKSGGGFGSGGGWGSGGFAVERWRFEASGIFSGPVSVPARVRIDYLLRGQLTPSNVGNIQIVDLQFRAGTAGAQSELASINSSLNVTNRTAAGTLNSLNLPQGNLAGWSAEVVFEVARSSNMSSVYYEHGEFIDRLEFSIESRQTVISILNVDTEVTRPNLARFNIITNPALPPSRIDLWLDMDGNGAWNSTTDRKVGGATRISNSQWAAAINTRSWPLGSRRVFAVAYERNSTTPSTVHTELAILNANPVIRSAVATPTRIRYPGAPLKMAVRNAGDPDGRIVLYELAVDRDESGDFSEGDTPLPSTTRVGEAITIPTNLFDPFTSVHYIIARALDNDGDYSLPFSVPVSVNKPPLLTDFSSNKTSVFGSETFELTVSGFDLDGSVSGAEFWWDVDRNGVLTPTADRRLSGSRRVPGTNTWKVISRRGPIPLGEMNFFARLIDNERITSSVSDPVIIDFNE